MSSEQLIYYETISYKVKCKFNSYNMRDDVKIDELTNIVREKSYCYGSDQYIKRFIEQLKEQVIKKLPVLNSVQIKIGIIDKYNIWHRFIIATTEMLFHILKINKKYNYYKSIFVIIFYEDKIVFTGSINFEGIE